VLAACGSSSSSTTSTHARSSATAKPASLIKVPGGSATTGATAKQAGIKKLARVPLGADFSPHIGGVAGLSTAQAIPILSSDLNAMWSKEFSGSGVQWPQLEQSLVQSSSVQTMCTSNPTVGPNDPMLLCYGQQPIFYWTVPWMQQNIDTDAGHVNLTLAMAGMYGDLIQDMFGFLQQLQKGQITQAFWDQQNICLVGVYARSLNDRKLFQTADASTFKTWLDALSGGSSSGAATHQQLTQAFSDGFNSGSPSNCALSSSTSSSSTST
jgi:predicted metalloprotease